MNLFMLNGVAVQHTDQPHSLMYLIIVISITVLLFSYLYIKGS